MKRFGLILALAILPAVLFAQPRTRSFTDRITAGTLSHTNDSSQEAWELKSVMFNIGDTSLTNQFRILHIRTVPLGVTYTDIVTTNTQIGSSVAGYVSTNTFSYDQGVVEETNTISFAASRNSTNSTATQIFDLDDFDYGLTFEYQDIGQFTFSDPSSGAATEQDFTLIRVYTVYPRP